MNKNTNLENYKNKKIYFDSLEFFTNKFVYYSKHETEYIVSLFCNLISKQNNIYRVFDICAGNGCIGISIKKRYRDLEVILLDKNIYAIECIVKNIILHSVKINFFWQNVFCFSTIACDVVVCNPPYIESKVLEKQTLFQTIYDSLNGGVDGLEFILKLFLILKNVHYVILELGSVNQFRILEKKIKNIWKCIEFFKPYEKSLVCFCTFKNLQI